MRYYESQPAYYEAIDEDFTDGFDDGFEDGFDDGFGEAFDDGYDEASDEAYDEASELGESRRSRYKSRYVRPRSQRFANNRNWERASIQQRMRPARLPRPGTLCPVRNAVNGQDLKMSFRNVREDVGTLRKQSQLLQNDKWLAILSAFVTRPQLITKEVEFFELNKEQSTKLKVATGLEDNFLRSAVLAGLIALRGKYGMPRALPLFAIIGFALAPDFLRSNPDSCNNGNNDIKLGGTLKLDTSSLLLILAAGYLLLSDGKKR
jgi:hypothetical protein